MNDPPEDDDDIHQPPRKRRKMNSRTRSTLLRTAPGRQARSGSASGSRQVRSSASGQTSSDRRGIPSPPSPQGSGDGEGTAPAPIAKYDEWPLKDAVLKSVMVNGLATFQIQFTWGPCANDGCEDRGTGKKSLGEARIPK